MAYPNSVYPADPWAAFRTPTMTGLGSYGQQGGGMAPAGGLGSGAQSPWLRAMLALVMQNAGARASGARLTARNAAPNDPSLAAYGALQGQLGGQSDASNEMAQVANSYYGQMNSQQFQEMMLRLRARLEEEQQRKAAGNPLLGGLGALLGKVGGAWLGPGGLWAGK